MKHFAILFLLITSDIFSQEIIPQTGHSGRFFADISADDRQMITGGNDGKIILWDLDKNLATKTHSHKLPVYAVGFSPDGTKFFVSTDYTLTIFETNTFKEIATIKEEKIILNAAWNPKFEIIGYSLENNVLVFYDASALKEWGSIDTPYPVTGLDFTSNGSIVFTAGGNLLAYSINEGKKMLEVPFDSKLKSVTVKVSENDKYVTSLLSDGSTEFFSIEQLKGAGNMPPCISAYENNNGAYVFQPVHNDNKHVFGVVDGNFSVTDITTNETNLYNINLGSPIISIIPSHKSNFLIIEGWYSNLIKVSFTADDFLKGNSLYWKKMQFATDRIYKIDFEKNDESIALTGNHTYHFNMKLGDLYKRNEDSLKLNATSFNTRVFTMPDDPKIYFPDFSAKQCFSIDSATMQITDAMSFACNKDTSVYALFSSDNTLSFYNLLTKKEKKIKITPGQLNTYLVPFAVYDYFILVNNHDLFVFSEKGETIYTQKNVFETGSELLAFDEKINSFYVIDKNSNFISIDPKTQKAKTTPSALSGSGYKNLELSADGTSMLIQQNDMIKVVDLANNKILSELKYTHNGISVMAQSNDRNMQAVADLDGIVHLYNLSEKKELAHIIVSPNNGLLVYNNNNEYMATKEAARSLAMKKDNKIIPFENMDILYNQQHKVLASIGKADPNILKVHEYVYTKRLKKSGINTSVAFNDLPVLELADNSVLRQSAEEKTTFKLSMKDANSPLTHLIVWLNGIESQRVLLNSKNEMVLDVEVDLLPGNNNIQFAVYNKNGLHSEKMELSVVSGQDKLPDLYLFSVGISAFNESQYNLKYASKDANDIQDMFKNHNASYNKIYTYKLTDKEATGANIISMMEKLKTAKKEDVIIITYSSHGVLDANMDYYLATADMDFTNPKEKGLAYSVLEKNMSELKPLRKVLFLDACHSGEVDKEDVKLVADNTSSSGNVKFRNVGTGMTTHYKIGLTTTSRLSNELFNDLRENSGTSVVASSSGVELSMESDEWKNGLFTYCLLTGLKNNLADLNKDKIISYTELKSFIESKVFELSNGKQQPTARTEIRYFDFRIW